MYENETTVHQTLYRPKKSAPWSSYFVKKSVCQKGKEKNFEDEAITDDTALRVKCNEKNILSKDYHVDNERAKR